MVMSGELFWRVGRVCGMVVGLVPLLAGGGGVTTRGRGGTPAAPVVIAVSEARCAGVVARLVLLAVAGDAAPLLEGAVRDIRWRLEVVGSPGDVGAGERTASLDAFTIRGDQATRADLALVRWMGAAGALHAEGALVPPTHGGAILAGDTGRILAFIRTPHGPLGLRGVVFDLVPTPQGLTLANPRVLPQAGCADMPATPTGSATPAA